jgi:phosphatidate cytidylyltransferase
MDTRRLITGLAVGGVWLLLLFSGIFWLFWLVCLLVGGVALAEYLHMVLPRLSRADKVMGVFLGLIPPAAAITAEPETVTAALFLSLFFLIGHTLARYGALAREDGGYGPFDLLLKLGFGIFYVGFSFSHFTLLLSLEQGKAWLLLLTAVTVAADSCAYYGGKLLGRHKLAPSISPGKTVEGFVAGTAGGVGAAVLVAMGVPGFIPPAEIALITLLLICVGVMGDLTESMIKRSMGVKDSGAILPGHGGVLDRMDSLMIATPLLFYLIHFGLVPAS